MKRSRFRLLRVAILFVSVLTGVYWITTAYYLEPGENEGPDEPLKVWPEEDDGDRMDAQLKYVPENLNEITKNGTKLKTILLYSYNDDVVDVNNTYEGQRTFLEDNCLVNTCNITYNNNNFKTSDVVIWTEFTLKKAAEMTRPNPDQVWTMYMLESPYNSVGFSKPEIFNLTATYRWDSDVPNPYGNFHLFDPSVKTLPQTVNYAAGKTKKVAWFLRNCEAVNQRFEYAIELSKWIEVHIYGRCIPKNKYECPKSKKEECYKMLEKNYKFYLAFENSNCRHYITEKMFVNSLQHNIIPVVMGARKEDYIKAAPYNSFIYVEDYESPKELAEYLHELDKNDTLYNEYFQWKGTGEFRQLTNYHFWCRFCAMIHVNRTKVYDMENWWRGPGVCTKKTWRSSGTLLGVSNVTKVKAPTKTLLAKWFSPED